MFVIFLDLSIRFSFSFFHFVTCLFFYVLVLFFRFGFWDRFSSLFLFFCFSFVLFFLSVGFSAGLVSGSPKSMLMSRSSDAPCSILSDRYRYQATLCAFLTLFLLRSLLRDLERSNTVRAFQGKVTSTFIFFILSIFIFSSFFPVV